MYLWLAVIVGSVLTVESGLDPGQGDCAKMATFNAGLITQVPLTDARRPLIPGGLSQADSDVYCLQELWLESDIEYLVNNEKIKQKYPYHYSQIHAGMSTLRPSPRNLWERLVSNIAVHSACSYWDRFYFTVVVGSCLLSRGCMVEFQKSNLHGTACMAQRCKHELMTPLLKSGCIQCLLKFMDSITEGGEECMPNHSVRKNRLNAAGLVLLSKKPLANARYINIHGEDQLVTQRGYLEADVEGIGKVVCTHLTSVFALFMEFDSDVDNYNQMQQKEINHLIQTFRGQDYVLMGDFNTGPEINATGVGAEFPDNYQLLEDAGYTNPYVALPGECTYCTDNPIANGLSNAAIDFVLISGTSLTAFSPRRIMDERTDPPYSDHYGVEVNVCHA